MLRRLRNRVLVVQEGEEKPHIFSTIFAQWITEMVSFVPIDKVDDLKAAIDEVKRGRFKAKRKKWHLTACPHPPSPPPPILREGGEESRKVPEAS